MKTIELSTGEEQDILNLGKEGRIMRDTAQTLSISNITNTNRLVC